VANEFNLATALGAARARVTEAQLAEQDRLNRVGRSRINPDSPQQRMARARHLEADAQEMLRRVRLLPSGPEKDEAMHRLFDRIGELAAEQGDYSRAAKISYTLARRLYYRKIRDAIRKPDKENCECPPDRLHDRAQGVEFDSPAMMVSNTIVGPGGNLLNLEICRKCGFANAR
jgi:hypothetical protein